MKIWEEITETTWCQRATNNGRGAYCAEGWILKNYAHLGCGDKGHLARNNMRNKLAFKIGRPIIILWNDEEERTFKDVLKAFKDADL